MCDYSLHNVPNRQAVEGEPLQVHRFPTGSQGLASPADLHLANASSWPKRWQQIIASWFQPSPSVPAVCIPAGTHLVLRDVPSSLQKGLGISAEEEVIFTQSGPETHAYRDGVRFQNGQEVLLQRLPVGLQLDVLYFSESRTQLPQLTMDADNIETMFESLNVANVRQE